MKKEMKTLITTLNAKYIHTSLAIRWLYVSASLHHDTDLKRIYNQKKI